MFHPLRRKDDTEESRDTWLEECRRGRARTVFFSMIAAGIVSVFIGNAYETAIFNEQAERAQQNCELTQRVGTKLAQISKDVSETSETADSRRRWGGYSREFASTVPPNAATCEQVFPKRSYLPFIE